MTTQPFETCKSDACTGNNSRMIAHYIGDDVCDFLPPGSMQINKNGGVVFDLAKVRGTDIGKIQAAVTAAEQQGRLQPTEENPEPTGNLYYWKFAMGILENPGQFTKSEIINAIDTLGEAIRGQYGKDSIPMQLPLTEITFTFTLPTENADTMIWEMENFILGKNQLATGIDYTTRPNGTVPVGTDD